MAGSLSVQFGTRERVDWHCDNWARWMGSGQSVKGFAHHSSGVTSGGASQDFDDMAEASDRRCAAIMDAIIADLSSGEGAAIHHAYLAAVYRFKETSEPWHFLAAAKFKIGLALKARGVW